MSFDRTDSEGSAAIMSENERLAHDVQEIAVRHAPQRPGNRLQQSVDHFQLDGRPLEPHGTDKFVEHQIARVGPQSFARAGKEMFKIFDMMDRH